jgi:uncharacterized Zn finger protein (UPF0148 family)
MSDFDKEAERKRLREKYEQEQADREATERMSELLLKGATMTNAHCSDCGDPIFRYDGQEFCATCERAVDRGDDASDGAEDQPTGDAEAEDAGDRAADADDGAADDGERIEVATPSEETQVQFDTDASDGQPAGSDRGVADRSEDVDGHESRGSPRERTTSTQAGQDRTRTPTPVPSVEPESGRSNAGAGLAEARDSLAGTLARLTRQAEAADDPTQAREYLEAAREAAEALAALRR